MKKGFTLVELLAVIALLGILATITVFATSNIISNSKESLSETQISKVEDAAKLYYLEIGMSESATCVNVSTLLENGYIEATEVKDPKTKKSMNGSVLITQVSNQYIYEYQTNICE